VKVRSRMASALLGSVVAAGLLPLLGGAAVAAPGDAVVSAEACTATDLQRNDDGSSTAVDLPFEVDFYGERYERLWVNNNGNVTFDGPQSTYTPFGLVDTQSVIIAPFFADVDTRGSGSDLVRYGYGTTVYQGRPAFCVNWLDVGYYNQKFDKLNSFQLVLVDRSDRRRGDVDIVFNYGGIEWETGDASGGVGGLGGSPARVGFSNGTGNVGTSFELVGSGVSGAFLDGNSATGLVNRSIGSTVDGRYVFEVRNGTPPPQTWVAMGDSYQSGVGTNEYYEDSGACQRSPYAYAPLLAVNGAVANRLQFIACSGATTHDLYDGRGGEPPQMDALAGEAGKDVALVTLGIGGNDLGFGPTLQNCITTNFLFRTCEDEFSDDVEERMQALTEEEVEDGLNRLEQVYKDVRFQAYRSKVLVLTYPRFFPYDGGRDFWTSGLLVPRCQNLRVSDQIWVNGQIRELDNRIVTAARLMGVRPVDLYDASQDREVCNRDGQDAFLNGVTSSNGFQDSFHPTRLGYELIADRLETEFAAVGASAAAGASDAPAAAASSPSSTSGSELLDELTIFPGQRLSVPFDVGAGAPAVGFSTSWPGSDVVMTLTSPSGRVIDRSTTATDVLHEVGPTQELYRVRTPEAGSWTVELYGADVSGSGEPVTLSAYAAPVPNEKPVARLSQTQQGNTVTLDGRASTDADGEIVHYIWEFDDGTVKEGEVVEYTYTQAGTYQVTLTVVDDRGSVDVASAGTQVVVSAYAFSGFQSPVEPAPALNAMKAGRAVPLKFSLGGDYGLDVLATGSPSSQRVECQTGTGTNEVAETTMAGQSSLSYDAASDTYTYVWKTESAWAGQCRQLTVTFDDGSSGTAVFRFR
jgi:PKD repeat protein/lysophospholipase L1-like esterase